MDRYPMAAAMRDIAAVRVGVTRARAERAGRSAKRAAYYRPRRGAPATTGNRAERGARPRADQSATDINLCVGWRRRDQRHCDARGRKQ